MRLEKIEEGCGKTCSLLTPTELHLSHIYSRGMRSLQNTGMSLWKGQWKAAGTASGQVRTLSCHMICMVRHWIISCSDVNAALGTQLPSGLTRIPESILISKSSLQLQKRNSNWRVNFTTWTLNSFSITGHRDLNWLLLSDTSIQLYNWRGDFNFLGLESSICRHRQK